MWCIRGVPPEKRFVSSPDTRQESGEKASPPALDGLSKKTIARGEFYKFLSAVAVRVFGHHLDDLCVTVGQSQAL